MVEIRDGDGLDAWLKGQPRDVSVIIAVRAALRVTPYLNQAFEDNYKETNRLTLNSFRALAVAWLYVVGKNQTAASLASEVAADSVHFFAKSYDRNFARSPAHVAYSVRSFDSGIHVVDAVVHGATAVRVDSPAVGASLLVGDGFRGDGFINEVSRSLADDAFLLRMSLWREIEQDAVLAEEVLKNGQVIGEQFRAVPLYSDENSHLALVNRAYWVQLCDALGPGWEPWVDWYNDRVAGKFPSAVFEKAVLSLTEEEWKLEPAMVNARLKELMEERREETFTEQPNVPAGVSLTGDAQVVRAADRLVSVRHNQEPFDDLDGANTELESHLLQDQNNLRFHLPYYDEFLTSIQSLKKQIKEGWVRVDLLRDKYRGYLELLARDIKTYATIIGIPIGIVTVALTAISRIFGS